MSSSGKTAIFGDPAKPAHNCTSGGLEMLFSNQRNHKLSLPTRDEAGDPVTVAFLIRHLCENMMQQQKKDLFILDDSVCVAHSVNNEGSFADSNIQTAWYPRPHQ